MSDVGGEGGGGAVGLRSNVGWASYTRMWPTPWCIFDVTYPLLLWADRGLWKHYLPETSFAGGSIGSSGRVGEGARNMKSMWLPLVAIFFMTYLYRAGGTMVPSAPPLDPLLGGNHHNFVIHQDIWTRRKMPVEPPSVIQSRLSRHLVFYGILLNAIKFIFSNYVYIVVFDTS